MNISERISNFKQIAEKVVPKKTPEVILFQAQEDEIRTLMTQSYLISQGNEGLHSLLFRLYLIDGLMPRELPKNPPDSVMTISPPANHALVGPNEKMRIDNTLGNLSRMWRSLHKITRKDDIDSMDREKIEEEAILDIVRADLYYQYFERPQRPFNPDLEEKPDSGNDVHKSMIRKHAVLKAPAGNPTNNTLFESAGEIITPEKFGHLGQRTDAQRLFIPTASKRVVWKIINRLSIDGAITHLILGWNLNHAGSGETFFTKQQAA